MFSNVKHKKILKIWHFLMFNPHIAKIIKGHLPLTFTPVTREPYIRDRSNYTFSDSLHQRDDILWGIFFLKTHSAIKSISTLFDVAPFTQLQISTNIKHPPNTETLFTEIERKKLKKHCHWCNLQVTCPGY